MIPDNRVHFESRKIDVYLDVGEEGLDGNRSQQFMGNASLRTYVFELLGPPL